MQLSIPDLDLRHIYESGQCFRWEPLGQDTYRIPAFGRTLTVRQTDGVFDFSCGAGEFDALWRSYFDLDTDYAAIKARVAPRDAYLQAAVAYGWGMRILRQDLWEVIVSFIVSQNNNIPRIRKSLRDLCAMQGGAFPTPAALAAAQPEVMDLVDGDEALREYARMVGAPAKILRTEEEVQARRAARAQQMRQQQAAAEAQQAVDTLAQGAQGAKTLSEVDPGGGALAALLGTDEGALW